MWYENAVIFQGYGPLLLEGVGVTLRLALGSMALAFLIGLLGAWAKLAKSMPLRVIATLYTTLIRGVPDLVLMLLIFYSLQLQLNLLTEALHLSQFDINPMLTGSMTLGFIYGAYFTETFRGAFQAVPKGQLEAGFAYGMGRFVVFRRILFPQLMRFALPGIANNWQVLLKATALVSIIGLPDIVKNAQIAGKGTNDYFYFIVIAGLIYLGLTMITNGILSWLERVYSMGVR